MYNTLVIKYVCVSTSGSPVPTQGCAKKTIFKHMDVDMT